MSKDLADIVRKEFGNKIEFLEFKYLDFLGNIRMVKSALEGGVDKATTDASSSFPEDVVQPTESDVTLVPDISTLVSLPWTEDTAMVTCDLVYPSKEGEEPKPFPWCSRTILKNVENQMDDVLSDITEQKYGKPIKHDAHFSPELEFFLYPLDVDPKDLPYDKRLSNRHYYKDLDENLEGALKDIIRGMKSLGLMKEKFHAEVAGSSEMGLTGSDVVGAQCEIGIGYGNALRMADAVVNAKYMVSKIAKRYNLKPLFMPKFNSDVNGNGMHVHQNIASTIKNPNFLSRIFNGDIKENIFYDENDPDGLSDIGKSYIAGLLEYSKEITALTNSEPNSYKRLVPGAEAPTYISWDWNNRTSFGRGHSRGKKNVRMECRAPDASCNIDLAFAAMLGAGLEGIDRNLELRPPDENRNFYHDNDGVERLPESLEEALGYMYNSDMLRKRLGDNIIDAFYQYGMKRCREFPNKSLFSGGSRVTEDDIEEYLMHNDV